MPKYRVVRSLTILGWTYIVERKSIEPLLISTIVDFWVDCGKRFRTKGKTESYIRSVNGEV